ncbi:MAG: hypothetical protein HYX75_04455 [Acidobacteria bacterium]|nr:hypothetical protein [Acidobacteriota bacterium]
MRVIVELRETPLFVQRFEDARHAQPGGTAKVVIKFDLRKRDADAPVLTSLKLLSSSGLPADARRGEKPELVRISAADYTPTELGYLIYQSDWLDAAHLYYRECRTGNWTELPLRLVTQDATTAPLPFGYIWESGLPSLTGCSSNRIDIKIKVRDKSGNSTEWIMEPGFVSAAP